MKPNQLFLLTSLFSLGAFITTNAQVTQALNNVSSASSYVGTSNNFDVLFKRQAVAAGLLSTTKTSFGVNSLAMPSSVSFGVSAGQFSSGTGFNTYIGQNAGKGTSASILNTGSSNTFIGISAGEYNLNGNGNVSLGSTAGYGNRSGNSNVFIGNSSGQNNLDGNYNVFIGAEAGSEFAQGNYNSYFGYHAGIEASGSNNVFIGANSGASFNGDNRLMIDVVDTATPLIWGDFAANQVKLNGKVGIGAVTAFPTDAGTVDVSGYNLFVTGGILTDEVRVYASSSGTWADYVFAKDYKLPTLQEVEKQIQEKGHLFNVPSAKEVSENGIELGEMAKIQQEKIEELTLYVIEQNKINEQQAKELEQQKKQIEELKALVTKLVK